MPQRTLPVQDYRKTANKYHNKSKLSTSIAQIVCLLRQLCPFTVVHETVDAASLRQHPLAY